MLAVEVVRDSLRVIHQHLGTNIRSVLESPRLLRKKLKVRTLDLESFKALENIRNGIGNPKIEN